MIVVANCLVLLLNFMKAFTLLSITTIVIGEEKRSEVFILPEVSGGNFASKGEIVEISECHDSNQRVYL